MKYRDIFKAICPICKVEQIPFHDEIDEDGNFDCMNDCGIIHIPNFTEKNQKWIEQAKNNREACFD